MAVGGGSGRQPPHAQRGAQPAGLGGPAQHALLSLLAEEPAVGCVRGVTYRVMQQSTGRDLTRSNAPRKSLRNRKLHVSRDVFPIHSRFSSTNCPRG